MLSRHLGRPRRFPAALALLPLLIFSLMYATACHRKGAVEPDSRQISNAMAAAAERAGGPGTRASLGIEPQPSVPEERRKNTIDVITVRVSDAPARLRVDQALDDVARHYGMVRTPETSTGRIVSWTYERGGVPTQAIRILLPAAGAGAPAPMKPIKPSAGKGPALAIIIDDLGYDQSADEAVLTLPRPLTVSVIPNLPLSREISEKANQRGYQVLLHMPMQPDSDTVRHEQVELQSGMTAPDVEQDSRKYAGHGTLRGRRQ